MKLIDTHTHLDFPEFDKTRENVINRARDTDVEIINCLLDPKGLAKIEAFGGIFLTIGCCPYRFDKYERQLKMLREHINKAIAVGEVGLDYYWVKDLPGRKREEENFVKLLSFSRDFQKPVIIHSRNAEKQALDILEKERVEKAIMHCFSGTLQDAERAIDMGYLVSIPTNITLSKQKQEFAKKLPLESLVLETDAPYLSPYPDKINEPANIVKSAEKISEITGISFTEVCRVTTKNAREFFGI